jgi:hypothetical protein
VRWGMEREGKVLSVGARGTRRFVLGSAAS